jgi:hypothetical protein
MTGDFFLPGKLPRARSFVQKIRQVYVKQPLARYLRQKNITNTAYDSLGTGGLSVHGSMLRIWHTPGHACLLTTPHRGL